MAGRPKGSGKTSRMVNKFTEKYNFEIGSLCKYIGGIHQKNAFCTITKRTMQKNKVYYSVIFEGTDKEVNWVQQSVLKAKYEQLELSMEEIANENKD